jgi:multiple sugar transport system substrate-binding protein
MDNNQNGDKNQEDASPAPIQKTVFEHETPQPIKVEEVAPSVESPEQIQGTVPPQYPTDVPVYEEHNNKFLFIGGVMVFFLIIFFLIFWFFIRDRSSEAPSPTGNEKVTLTYWGLWDEKAIYDPLIKEYQSKHKNITIQYEKMEPKQYRERLIARSKSGNGPDIFRFHNTWVPELQEVLTPLPSEIMSNANFEKTFYKIHQTDLKVGDSYYGIPLMIDGLVLIYNEALLKQAGVLAPPAVWVGDENDVLNTAGKLTVRDASGALVTSGIAIGTATNIDHFGEIFGILLLLNGGDLKKLDAPEAAEALELYRKFAEENYWNDTMSNSIASFIEGRTAMIFGPSWQVINIKAQNPNLTVKVASMPKGLEGSQISISNYWVEGVNKYSKHQIEAWNFLAYLSEKESMSKMYEEQTKTRPFGSAYSRKDLGDTLKANEYLSPIIQMAAEDHLRSLPVVDRTYDNGLNDDVLKYLENAINETANGVDYSSALKTAQAGVSQVLKKYGIE